jgi:hypothetical protein
MSDNTTTKDLVSQQWQPIATVPFNQYVICLWGTCTIGSSIFFTDQDVKHTYAKYWIPMPKFPDNE